VEEANASRRRRRRRRRRRNAPEQMKGVSELEWAEIKSEG
jgi:hypothetical protein